MVTIFFKRFSEQLDLFTSDYKGKLPQENNLMRFHYENIHRQSLHKYNLYDVYIDFRKVSGTRDEICMLRFQKGDQRITMPVPLGSRAND